MHQKQLNAIKERVAKASQGPWELDEDKSIWNKEGRNYLGSSTMNQSDVEFIAHAREDVPSLVAEVERLHQTLEKIMEVEAPIMEGWETTTYKIARQALGGESHE